MRTVTLSKHTVPGRLGFPYAMEWHLAFGNYYQTMQHINKLRLALEPIMGREYQKHWRRVQRTRRWYTQSLDGHIRQRFCFKTRGDLLLAQMLYEG